MKRKDKKPKKPHGYWTKDRCYEEALKYITRSEFMIGSNSAYLIARRKGWLETICSHMRPMGNRMKRCIYAYEFIDKSIYVGLTYNVQKRYHKHMIDKTSAIYQHIKQTGLFPELKFISEFLSIENAQQLEKEIVLKYKNQGYMILNKAKTGALGSTIIKWTREKCIDAANKCTFKHEFAKKYPGARASAIKNGWYTDICSHMQEGRKPNHFWTKEKCQEQSIKYKTKKEFKIGSKMAYETSCTNKWIDDICTHMNNTNNKPQDYWDFKKCKEEALLYDNRKQFEKNSGGAYSASRRNSWLNVICSHMKQFHKPNGYWESINTLKKELLLLCDQIKIFPSLEKMLALKRGDLCYAIKLHGGITKIKPIFKNDSDFKRYL